MSRIDDLQLQLMKKVGDRDGWGEERRVGFLITLTLEIRQRHTGRGGSEGALEEELVRRIGYVDKWQRY